MAVDSYSTITVKKGEDVRWGIFHIVHTPSIFQPFILLTHKPVVNFLLFILSSALVLFLKLKYQHRVGDTGVRGLCPPPPNFWVAKRKKGNKENQERVSEQKL